MTCGCPPAPTGGSVMPANIGSLLVTGLNPPFGIHQALSPVFMLYAVTPPISFGLAMLTPPTVVPPPRPPPPPRPAGGGTPGSPAAPPPAARPTPPPTAPP